MPHQYSNIEDGGKQTHPPLALCDTTIAEKNEIPPVFPLPLVHDDGLTNDQAPSSTSPIGMIQSLKSSLSLDGNMDAWGCALVKIPEAATLITASIYFSTAIVKIASRQAGCLTEIPEGQSELPECNNRVYGIKPSSMVSLFIMVLGIVSAFCMPLVGALLDSSNCRRSVGGITALVIAIFTFIEFFLSENNWFAMFILQLFGSVILTINTCVALAYLPELTEDKKKLAKYNTVILIFNSMAVVIFLVGMTIVTSILNDSNDAIVSARIALLTTFILQVLCYGISWTKLFGSRQADGPAISSGTTSGGDEKRLCPKCTLLRRGVASLKRTLIKAFKSRSEVRFFLIFRASSQPAIVAFTACVLSFLNDQIQISPRDLGIASLIVLSCAIPGNKLSLSLMERMDPLSCLKICMVSWAALPPIFVLLVNRKGHEMRLFLISIFWGLLIGWKEPADKTLLCNLVPKGIEAEMMGLYIFSSQIVMWLPPLIFTVMNENNFNIKFGIAAFAAYFLLGLLSLVCMGSFDDIVTGTKAHEKDEIADQIQSHRRSRSLNDIGTLHVANIHVRDGGNGDFDSRGNRQRLETSSTLRSLDLDASSMSL